MAMAHDRKTPNLESLTETFGNKRVVAKKSAKPALSMMKPALSVLLSSKPQGKRPSRKKPRRPSVRPLEDAQIERITGIPEDAQIAQALASLSEEDQAVARKVRDLLAKHLGSHAAARLWLASRAPGFESTPLDAIRQGQAKMVLATLESQWGRSPTYA
jgi:hypothetical protein